MKPRLGSRKQVAIRSGIVREKMPFPVVYYPNHYGTFFAFSENERSKIIVLCACNEGAVRNSLALKDLQPEQRNSNPLRMAPLDSGQFPNILAERSLSIGMKALQFKERLCHRCNLEAPSLSYCAEMYGGLFKQNFGWYINQTYYRLGIGPWFQYVLEDICPADLRAKIAELQEATGDYTNEMARLTDMMADPLRKDIEPDEVTYWHNVKSEEAQPMIALRRRATKLKTVLANEIENITRAEFGFGKVGESWIGETMLFQIVERLFPGERVIRHYRPEWLDGLELDIHVANVEIAFEYQGQQHFHPIKAWGGAKALKALQKRDKRKAAICKQRGVRLVTIDYTEPLNDDYIKRRLEKEGV